jgi:hypothetical protein
MRFKVFRVYVSAPIVRAENTKKSIKLLNAVSLSAPNMHKRVLNY